MAKLIITNKVYSGPIFKSFRVKITKLCNMVKQLTDTLYHDGINSKPVDGDTIFTGGFNGLIPFKNNTAALNIDNKFLEGNESNDKLYIKTNYLGKCTIINCNNNGNVYDNN